LTSTTRLLYPKLYPMHPSSPHTTSPQPLLSRSRVRTIVVTCTPDYTRTLATHKRDPTTTRFATLAPDSTRTLASTAAHRQLESFQEKCTDEFVADYLLRGADGDVVLTTVGRSEAQSSIEFQHMRSAISNVNILIDQIADGIEQLEERMEETYSTPALSDVGTRVPTFFPDTRSPTHPHGSSPQRKMIRKGSWRNSWSRMLPLRQTSTPTAAPTESLPNAVSPQSVPTGSPSAFLEGPALAHTRTGPALRAPNARARWAELQEAIRSQSLRVDSQDGATRIYSANNKLAPIVEALQPLGNSQDEDDDGSDDSRSNRNSMSNVHARAHESGAGGSRPTADADAVATPSAGPGADFDRTDEGAHAAAHHSASEQPPRQHLLVLTRWKTSKSRVKIERHGQPLLEVLLFWNKNGKWAVRGPPFPLSSLFHMCNIAVCSTRSLLLACFMRAPQQFFY
jgi:hypothetical protein